MYNPYLIALNFERYFLQVFSFAIASQTEPILPPKLGIMNIAFNPAI
jgi:hypothetical protein